MTPEQRQILRAFAALLAGAALLAACSETPLNVAPVVDKSHALGEAPAPAMPADGTYTVQPGDTLFHIAMTYHVGLRDMARWNGMETTTPIKVGQRLYVRDPGEGAAAAAGAAPAAAPPAEESETPAEVHAISLAAPPAAPAKPLEGAPLAPLAGESAAATPGASGAGAGAAPPMPVPAPETPAAPAGTMPLAALAPQAPTLPATGPWLWPVEGNVVVPFDATRGKGIDIAVVDGATVRAVADGTVIYAGSPAEYGNLLVLQHSDTTRTVYAHAKSILAKHGDTVKRGQAIATAGQTGVGPPLLHFEVRVKGVPANPLDFLPPR